MLDILNVDMFWQQVRRGEKLYYSLDEVEILAHLVAIVYQSKIPATPLGDFREI